VSHDFLTVSAGQSVVARSPMEGPARAAGARFEVRDGWNVAIEYPGQRRSEVAWVDVSHMRTLELQATREELDGIENLRLGEAVRVEGAWWCRLTPTRGLIVGGAGDVPGALDVTSNFAALTLVGPLARETFARFCALDLRPSVTPVGALRPGSIARQPGVVIREDVECYLFLFGWATGEYMWSVVADAATHLGGGPLGLDAPAELIDA
jgi:glycine cleavage system aminomethyltransferase T